jgi:mannose-6-phosphate isomerase
VLNAALSVVAERFATEDGLYEASLGEDWSPLGSGPLQNPLMHLAEAFLATLAVREDAEVKQALQSLAAAMQAHFIDPDHGVMLEKPRGAVDNWFEPGHQFEWYYLLESSELLRNGALHQSLNRAFAYAEHCGVSNQRVLAMLNTDGSVRDATQRIWAQAEYLRALTLRANSQGQVLQQLLTLQQHFLHSGGWYECLDAQGVVSRSDMPSTTPYHLATCYIGLAATL